MMANKGDAPAALTVSDLAAVLQAMDEKYQVLEVRKFEKAEMEARFQSLETELAAVKTKLERDLDGLKRKVDLIQTNKDVALDMVYEKDAEATKQMAVCPQLIRGGRGVNQDWCGRGRGHGRFPFACGSDHEKGMQLPARAHITIVGEKTPKTINVEMTVDELQKWRQFKRLSIGEVQIRETSAPSSSTSFSGNKSNNLGHNHTLAAGAQWLIDSGASRHMAGSNREFYKYASESKTENVKLADGSTQEVVGSGMVKCSPNMSLSSVLHVPAFPINLLSISCITKELNCAAIFYPTWCIFQELGTGRNLGMGSMRDGLYYLDNNISSAAATKR